MKISMKNISKKSIGKGALMAPLPVVIISTGDELKTNLMTVEWVGIINTKPPMLSVSIRPERYSYELINQNSKFIVHVLRSSQWHLADWVGTRSGRNENQIKLYQDKGITMETLATGYPQSIKGTPLCLLCEVVERKLLGTHELIIANIEDVFVEHNLVDNKGKLRINEIDLLSYSHGSYRKVEEVVGYFGESRATGSTLKKLRERRGSKKNTTNVRK